MTILVVVCPLSEVFNITFDIKTHKAISGYVKNYIWTHQTTSKILSWDFINKWTYLSLGINPTDLLCPFVKVSSSSSLENTHTHKYTHEDI